MGYTFQFAQLAPWTGEILAGIGLTIRLSVEAIVLAFLIGVAGALGRMQGNRAVRFVVAAYVEIIRNTPFIVQIFLIFFALPGLGIRLDPNRAALAALALNGGAYLTEIIRAGFLAVPKGQIEAGRALGLTPRQIVLDVILVPGLKAVYPAMTSEFIILFLNTSICSIIAARELTSVGNTIEAQTFRSFEVYFLLLAIYLGLSLVFSGVFRAIDRLFLTWRA